MGNKSELWSLYGNIGNKRVQPIRSICRNRLTGIDPFSVEINLDRAAVESRKIAEHIRMLDGSERAANKAEKVSKVHDFWQERPLELRRLIKDVYASEYQGGSENSNTDFEESGECPYEENPESRSCWACHLPVKVYQRMAVIYNEEKENDSS